MANLVRGNDAGETALAAATAAIITARWGAPSRAHRTPARSDDFMAVGGPGAAFASPAPVSPVPVPVIPETDVPFSPFTPVSPAVGPVASAPPFVPVSPAPPAASVPPTPSAPSGRVGGRASVGDRRIPPPPDGFDAVYAPNGHAPDYGPTNGNGSDKYGSHGNGSHEYGGHVYGSHFN